MNFPRQPQVQTRLFARVIGPYLVVIAATAATHPPEMRTLVSDFAANPLWCWVTGAFVMLLGFLVVAFHQNWHGAPAIVVSVLGWVVALKGLFLVVFPQTYLAAAGAAMDAVSWWRVGFIVVAVVGVYLTYVGWVPVRSRPAPQAANAAPDLPRAA